MTRLLPHITIRGQSSDSLLFLHPKAASKCLKREVSMSHDSAHSLPGK